MPPSSRASSAFPPSSARATRPRLLQRGAKVTVSCAEGDTGHVYAGAIPIEISTVDLASIGRPRTQIMVNLGNPDLAFKTAMRPNDGRRPGAHGIHHQRAYRHPSDGAGLQPEKVTSAADREAIARLTRAPRQADGFLRRAPVGGRRHDRRGLLSEAGDRPAVGLQDQRIRQAARRRRLRAEGREPDAGIPRRLALRPSGLCAGLRPGMRGAAARARGHGTDQPARHGALLPAGRRGAARHRRHGAATASSAARTGSKST